MQNNRTKRNKGGEISNYKGSRALRLQMNSNMLPQIVPPAEALIASLIRAHVG